MRSSLCRRSCARNHARMFYAKFFCLHCHVIARRVGRTRQTVPPGTAFKASTPPARVRERSSGARVDQVDQRR